jgi:membrane protease YdiL (CAAX protease family)
MRRPSIVRIQVIVSGVLLLLAWVGSRIANISIVDRVSISAGSVIASVSAGILLAATALLCTAPWARNVPVLRDLRRVWDTLLVSLARELRATDIILLALLSGMSEELFFRGILQPVIGLTAASLVFGIVHCVTPAYAAWAGGLGALLGAAYIATGNLIVPITIHATYNFVALVYLRYWYIGRMPAHCGDTHQTHSATSAS